MNAPNAFHIKKNIDKKHIARYTTVKTTLHCGNGAENFSSSKCSGNPGPTVFGGAGLSEFQMVGYYS